jgi:hypothetical protein
MILELKSVGSVIDTETKIVYAAYNEEARQLYGIIYDKDSGVHLDKCSKEWVDDLSEHDITLINENC